LKIVTGRGGFVPKLLSLELKYIIWGKACEEEEEEKKVNIKEKRP